jgi:hypothetical protein
LAQVAFSTSRHAHSEIALEAANEWYRTSALSRRNNPAKTLMLVVQQRLHTNDLSGFLIEHGWPSLVMPAIATEERDYTIADGEFYHRPAKELLQPIGIALMNLRRSRLTWAAEISRRNTSKTQRRQTAT